MSAVNDGYRSRTLVNGADATKDPKHAPAAKLGPLVLGGRGKMLELSSADVAEVIVVSAAVDANTHEQIHAALSLKYITRARGSRRRRARAPVGGVVARG